MLHADNKLIFNGVFGSHLYGTSTPESDKDYKGIFLPTKREILMGDHLTHFTNNTNNHESKNTKDDVDVEYYSLKYFIAMAKKGETITIDMLHTPNDLNSVKNDPVWNYVQQNRSRFYTTDMKAYLGYVKRQAGKYGVKGTRVAALRQLIDSCYKLEVTRIKTPEEMDSELEAQFKKGIVKHIKGVVDMRIRDVVKQLPLIDGLLGWHTDAMGNVFYDVLGRKFQDTMTIYEFKIKIDKLWNEYGERARKAEANEGIDWKALHHACRGGDQLLEIYRTGDLKYPLHNAPFLKSIKEGNEPFNIVQEYLESLLVDVEHACANAAKNGMDSKVDSKFWDDFIYDVHSDIIKQGIKL